MDNYLGQPFPEYGWAARRLHTDPSGPDTPWPFPSSANSWRVRSTALA
jgi:hypothetical protein